MMKNGRILIIDDEPDLADVYSQILSRDHEVVVMLDGQQAFQLLLRDPNFDLILSDLTMPHMTGVDLYRELEKYKVGLEEKIVFVTGGVFSNEAHEFLQKVTNVTLEKPLSTKRLREVAHEMVNKQLHSRRGA